MNESQRQSVSVRPAEQADAERVAEIFNQGVEDRVATFETDLADAETAGGWIREDLVVVAERGGALVGWAKASPYADRHRYYDGVREATLYVERDARRTGVGRVLLEVLAEAAAEAGAHKLVGKVFTSNAASIAMIGALGWRAVGVHEGHSTLDGEWKDVLVVEKLL